MLLIKIAALALATTSALGAPLAAFEGSHKQCIGGKMHSLEYSAVGLGGASFVDLDGDLGSHLSSMQCDIDHTKLTLHFHNSAEATEWVLKFHDFTDHFIVGGTRWNCTTETNRPGYILRRVVGASQGAHLSRTLTVTTSLAQYSEVFETASISYGSGGACDNEAVTSGPLSLQASTARAGVAGPWVELAARTDKEVCLGFNTDCTGSATQQYPLFSNEHLSVACTDCWAALMSDLFVDVKIGGWKLQSLSGGFRNATLNASMVLDAQANANWNLALDKSLPLAQTTYLLNFKIGSVPFMLYFEIPMEVTGSLEFDTRASLTVGTSASLQLGDATIAWDPTNHWTHTAPVPDFAHAVKPVLTTTTTADLNMAGSLSINPQFNMYFNQMFSYSLQATPSAKLNVVGNEASKQACLTSTYGMDLVSTAAAHINIDLIDFHKDWNWGPKSIFSKTGSIVPQTCVPL